MDRLKAYYTDMVDRAVRTAAQSGILALGADQFNVIDVDWSGVAGFAAGGAALSVLTTLTVGGVLGRKSQDG